MLFTINDIKKETVQPIEYNSSSDKNNFGEIINKKKLKEVCSKIRMGETIHVISYVEWSLHDVLLEIINITGPAKVWATTWAISENPVRAILQMIETGLITQLNCLFDTRIKSQCPQAYQLIQRNFTNLYLTDIHAKVLVIENELWKISVTSTANMTNKRRIEKYVISCNKETANFDKAWIQKQMQTSNPFK
jgi:hypothetical protein